MEDLLTVRLCSCVTILSRLSWETSSNGEGIVLPCKCLQEQQKGGIVDLSRLLVHLFHTDSLFPGSSLLPYWRSFPHWSHKVDHQCHFLSAVQSSPFFCCFSIREGEMQKRTCSHLHLAGLVQGHCMILGNFSGRCSWAQQWCKCVCVCVQISQILSDGFQGANAKHFWSQATCKIPKLRCPNQHVANFFSGLRLLTLPFPLPVSRIQLGKYWG